VEAGVYLVDGPVLLAEAVDAGVPLVAVYVEPVGLQLAAVREARRRGVPVAEVVEGALAKVLDVVTPRHVVAVARPPTFELREVLGGTLDRPVLGLVGVQDPGNAGTLVRVAEAAGCAGVVLTTGSVDVHNPKCVRATAGSLFRVPVVEGVTVDSLLAGAAAAGRAVVGTVGPEAGPADGAGPSLVAAPEDVDLTGGPLLLVGSEAHGLDGEIVGQCDLAVSVPMEGRVESLNASVAGAVVAFEAARQRRAHRPADRGGQPSGRPAVTLGHNDAS
jgi:RNA methyltransferase, TrmH family